MGKTEETDAPDEPTGELLLRTLAMPADANPNGDIFGGWIMSQMDIAAGILAKEISESRTATVAVDRIVFRHPVAVGDVVCCHGSCRRIGNTSMTIDIQVWVRRLETRPASQRYLVTEAVFTFVAIDADGRPQKVQHRHD
jgi:acyl-CoA thioesterase YciA